VVKEEIIRICAYNLLINVHIRK